MADLRLRCSIKGPTEELVELEKTGESDLSQRSHKALKHLASIFDGMDPVISEVDMLTFEGTGFLFQGRERGFESLQAGGFLWLGCQLPFRKGRNPGQDGEGHLSFGKVLHGSLWPYPARSLCKSATVSFS